ncbi:MAG: M20/M25/M40 family metallo-hydrolase [Acidobacteria bacterium]|nr:M20/M25/M40 family metallo-hydrolase [Acidobacteriota bacterium]
MTPSRGLDLAAEYLASQFRRYGLEAAGNRGYFHETAWKVHVPDLSGFAMELVIDGKPYPIPAGEVTVISPRGFQYSSEPVVTGTGDIAGKVVFARGPAAAQRRTAALAIIPDPNGRAYSMLSGARPFQNKPDASRAPVILVHSNTLPEKAEEIKLTLRLAEPREQPMVMRNVAAIVRGSDPDLSRSYIVAAAHYDHIGRLRHSGRGDRLFNGANDDASGTAALLEIAERIARMPQKPARSILFLATSGEEQGLLGTRAFLSQPPVPLESIAANVCFEVLGRTDMDGGLHEGKLTVTGIDFTSMGQVFIDSGKATGIEVYKHPQNEAFYNRSDNIAFAQRGIPAHTVSNAFIYPDYHGVRDEWDRLNYPNMARLIRTITAALLQIANDREAPRWAEIPATSRYRGVTRGQASSTP